MCADPGKSQLRRRDATLFGNNLDLVDQFEVFIKVLPFISSSTSDRAEGYERSTYLRLESTKHMAHVAFGNIL